MDFALKPHPLMAHWVPGFASVSVALLSHFDWNYDSLAEGLAPTDHRAIFNAFVLAVTAFVIGEILDSLRDICEWGVDYFCGQLFPEDWGQILSTLSEQQRRIFEEHYFTYYVCGANLALASFLVFISGLVQQFHISWLSWVSLIIPYRVHFFVACAMVILWADALLIRREMQRVIKQWGPSKIASADNTSQKKFWARVRGLWKP